MGWIRIAGKGLEYAGKLAQADGFEDWAEEQGRALVTSIAEKQAFSFFGRRRKAKKLLLKELKTAARSESLSAALQEEAKLFPEVVGQIAEKIEPNKYIAAWKPFVIPRFLVNAVASRGIEQRLSRSNELERLQGGAILGGYFLRQLLVELDAAFTQVPFSIKQAVHFGKRMVRDSIRRNFRLAIATVARSLLCASNWESGN